MVYRCILLLGVSLASSSDSSRSSCARTRAELQHSRRQSGPEEEQPLKAINRPKLPYKNYVVPQKLKFLASA